MLKSRKSHKIVLKTYQLLVTFLAPGMDDMVQSQHGNLGMYACYDLLALK